MGFREGRHFSERIAPGAIPDRIFEDLGVVWVTRGAPFGSTLAPKSRFVGVREAGAFSIGFWCPGGGAQWQSAARARQALAVWENHIWHLKWWYSLGNIHIGPLRYAAHP